MKIGQEGLNRKNIDYFEDLLPSNCEDARNRRLTVNQLGLVKVSQKFFDKEKENQETALKIEKQKTEQKTHLIKIRRQSLVENLRNKRLVRAEIEKSNIKNWKVSLGKIKQLKQKDIGCRRLKIKSKKSRKYSKLRKIAADVVAAYDWCQADTKNDMKGTQESSKTEEISSREFIPQSLENKELTEEEKQEPLDQLCEKDSHLDKLFSETVTKDKEVCFESRLSQSRRVVLSLNENIDSHFEKRLNKFDLHRVFKKKAIMQAMPVLHKKLSPKEDVVEIKQVEEEEETFEYNEKIVKTFFQAVFEDYTSLKTAVMNSSYPRVEIQSFLDFMQQGLDIVCTPLTFVGRARLSNSDNVKQYKRDEHRFSIESFN